MKPSASWLAPDRHIGRVIDLFDSLESTNALALSLADDLARDGQCFVAREQTAGRGQHGRSWWSAPDASLLMSVLLFPPAALRRPVVLTALAAVAVCDTIRDLCGLDATIKWPNDVLIAGKKVCGILIEQRQGTVIGIGLNLLQKRREFDAAGLETATSLYAASRRKLVLPIVAGHLCSVLDHYYQQMLKGRPARLERRWRSLLALQRRFVLAECHHGDYHGRLRRLSFDAIEIEQRDGTTTRLIPEAIRHLKRADVPPGI